jgi:hypothetical protein
MINTNNKKINFPAFPVSPYAGDRDNLPIKSNTGMSMRDFFASMCLVGLAGEIIDKNSTAEKIADSAYEIADAMLRKLGKL